MKANDLGSMPDLLADWVVRLVASRPILQTPESFASFMAYIAEEEITYLEDLSQLFDQWEATYVR